MSQENKKQNRAMKHNKLHGTPVGYQEAWNCIHIPEWPTKINPRVGIEKYKEFNIVEVTVLRQDKFLFAMR